MYFMGALDAILYSTALAPNSVVKHPHTNNNKNGSSEVPCHYKVVFATIELRLIVLIYPAHNLAVI